MTTSQDSSTTLENELPADQNLCCTQVSYLWTINNFSSETSYQLRSPVFKMEDNSNWFLKIYPNGVRKSCRGYVSLFLCLKSSNKSAVNSKIKFSILNSKKEVTHSFKTERIFNEDTDWGYSNFISRETLLDKNSSHIEDGKLNLLCKLTLEDPADCCTKKNDLPIPECCLSEDLSQAFDKREFTDVTLQVSDKEFQAHKFILAARSPVFCAMFQHDMIEKKTNLVRIEDIDKETLEEMLIFMYTGKVYNLESVANNLLAAADKYKLDRLKALCEVVLLNKLTVENSIETLVTVDLHGSKIIKAKVIEFIINNAKDVVDTERWNEMVTTNPQLFTEVFRGAASRL